MNKKDYITPEMEVVMFNVEDIMKTSGLGNGGDVNTDDGSDYGDIINPNGSF